MDVIYPTIIEKTPTGEKHYDLLSKHFEQRNVFIVGEINNAVAVSTIAQLIYLNSFDSTSAINVYINSPGGSVVDGLSIMDCWNSISAPINTIGFGMCASMGAFLLAAGKKDSNSKRQALPNCQIMIHQVSGVVSGQASDIRILAEQAKFMNQRLREYLCQFTGKTLEEIEAASDRDNYMTPEQAIEFGLLDGIVGA